MSIIISVFLASLQDGYRKLVLYITGLFLLHFAWSSITFFIPLSNSLKKVQWLSLINHVVFHPAAILLGLVIFWIGIRSFGEKSSYNHTNQINIEPNQKQKELLESSFGAFLLGIISPIIDLPALVEYAALDIWIHTITKGNMPLWIGAVILINIVFQSPIIIIALVKRFWSDKIDQLLEKFLPTWSIIQHRLLNSIFIVLGIFLFCTGGFGVIRDLVIFSTLENLIDNIISSI